LSVKVEINKALNKADVILDYRFKYSASDVILVTQFRS